MRPFNNEVKMSEKNNAKCDICGKEYYVCRACSEVNKFNPWRTVTDTFEHYIIFLALSEYRHNGDVEHARKMLSSCDLSGMKHFNKNIIDVISEIMDNKNSVAEHEEAPQVKIKPVARKSKKEKNIEQ